MALWIADITFLSNLENEKRKPKPMEIVVAASNIENAGKKTAKFLNTLWPYWKFDIRRAGKSQVIK